MLMLAAILLGLTAVSGLAVLWRYQRIKPVGWRQWPGLGHGLLGLIGVAMLLGGLGGPERGVQMGAGSFGTVAAWLFGLALTMAALAFLARRRGSRIAALAVGLHATFAIAGLTMLVAYLSYPA